MVQEKIMIIESCSLDLMVNAKPQINRSFMPLNMAMKTKVVGWAIKMKIWSGMNTQGK